MEYHLNIFKDVDVIVTPTTGMTAPVIPPDALKNGETNIQVTSLSSKTLTSYFWCNLIHSTFTSEF
jgi:Asp-tRNA(Asn)/Glu-tRNA(Gln) amidotransferase A subunit family amidase